MVEEDIKLVLGKSSYPSPEETEVLEGKEVLEDAQGKYSLYDDRTTTITCEELEGLSIPKDLVKLIALYS